MTSTTENRELTEPLIVGETVVSGFDTAIEGGIVHFTGWVLIAPDEHRIVERFAMELAAAKECCRLVHRALFGYDLH